MTKIITSIDRGLTRIVGLDNTILHAFVRCLIVAVVCCVLTVGCVWAYQWATTERTRHPVEQPVIAAVVADESVSDAKAVYLAAREAAEAAREAAEAAEAKAAEAGTTEKLEALKVWLAAEAAEVEAKEAEDAWLAEKEGEWEWVVVVAQVMILLVMIGLYFLPTLVAMCGKRKQVIAIFVLNFLLGWTGIWWVGALVWAFVED